VALLEIQGLSVTFGGVHAVSGLNLEVRQQQIVGLVGANGAGKTTAIDAISGFVASKGSVLFDGRDISSERAFRRADWGLSRTWQGVQLFADLTVRENLLVAVAGRRRGDLLRSMIKRYRTQQLASLSTRLEGLGLPITGLLDRPADSLSQGERKLVGLCRALVSNPKLLLADEPAAGLDSDETQELGRVFTSLAAAGLSTLLVDHDMGLVLGICDYVYVLDHGELIAQGRPEEIRTNQAVLAAYLGHKADGASSLDAEEQGSVTR
jgi:branched-chain amino acid transport system ATP-binding protein